MEVTLQSFRKRFTYDPAKDLLGKGGFGEVYKAYDNEDHIFVALKISQGTADDKYNLINEIKRFKKLSHHNIVKHIEAYEVNTGSTDIHGKPILYHVGILEYADHGTLADLLKKPEDFRSFGNFGSLIEDLATDIIEGLAYLHSKNIIHRDLKPTNILLFSEGEKLRAKITDFGIAKRTDATAASTQLVGTVEYMAPEFFSTGNITPASDVWSVGVMLLEALTGTHPFGKTTQGLSNEQIINNILNKDLSTAAQNLTEPLKGIITRCLLREPNLRPQSANELKGLLQASDDTFSEKTQLIIRPRNESKGISKPRKKKLLVAFVFVLSTLSIGIIGWLVSSGKIGFNNKPADDKKSTLDFSKVNKESNLALDSSKESIDASSSNNSTTKLPSPYEVLGTEHDANTTDPNNRKVYCWYGYQEKKIGEDNKGGIVVYDVVNYSSEIIELSVPKQISNSEVSHLIEKHFKEYCPFKEKERGKNYYYTITGKRGPNVLPTLSQAISERSRTFGSPVIFTVCSKHILQNNILNAKHQSYDNPNKFGINFYCVAFWYNLEWIPELSKVKRTSYVSPPIKIKCATDDNIDMMNELLQYHIENNCIVPEGFTVGVSSFMVYQEALDYITEQFPEGEAVEVCNLNYFQKVVCKKND